MTANVITYRGRSAAREVGKVLSLDDRHIVSLFRQTLQHVEEIKAFEVRHRASQPWLFG